MNKSHKTSGILKIIDLSHIYDLIQFIAGYPRVSKKLLEPVIEFSKHNKNVRILDIGCGTGQIVKYLPKNVSYVGWDFNSNYINKAQNLFEKKNIDFVCLDINDSSLKSKDKYDFVFLAGVIHHLDDISVKKLFQTVIDNLDTNGTLLTVDPTFITNQNRIAKFIISQDRGKSVRTSLEMKNIQKEYFSTIDHNLINNLGNIPYDHLFTFCKK